MKALSIRQPWAWAILHAGKGIENRAWRGYGGNSGRDVGFRGEFLIHASMRPSRPAQLKEELGDFLAFCRDRSIVLPSESPDVLFGDCGGIVGRARIVDIRPNDPTCARSPWEIPGQLGLVLADVVPLPFVPCKGALGFWNVPAAVLEAVEKARAA